MSIIGGGGGNRRRTYLFAVCFDFERRTIAGSLGGENDTRSHLVRRFVGKVERECLCRIATKILAQQVGTGVGAGSQFFFMQEMLGECADLGGLRVDNALNAWHLLRLDVDVGEEIATLRAVIVLLAIPLDSRQSRFPTDGIDAIEA